MGKVIKILCSLLSALILAAIILPLAGGMLLGIPAVQDFALERLSRWASRKMGTTVTLGSIGFRIPNQVTAEAFYVEDYQGDTLLWVRKADVRIRSLGLRGGELRFEGAKLDGVRFFLDQKKGMDSLNLQQAIGRLRSRRTQPRERPFRLAIEDIELSDAAFKYHRYPERRPAAGVDVSDMELRGLHIGSRRLQVCGDSVALNLHDMRFREKSGFRVDDLGVENFTVCGGKLQFDDLHLQTPASDVRLGRLHFTAPSWQEYKDFIRQVHIEADLQPSKVSFSTIAWFAPSLGKRPLTFDRVQASFSGTVASFGGRITEARCGETVLSGTYRLEGIPNIRSTRFGVDIRRLQTSAPDMERLLARAGLPPLPDRVRAMLDRAGDIGFKGGFDGSMDRFAASGFLSMEQGGVALDVALEPGGQDTEASAGQTQTAGNAEGSVPEKRFRGTLSTVNFSVGDLLGSNRLGRLSLRTEFSGAVCGDRITLDAGALIPLLRFNGYDYRALSLEGRFDERRFEGVLSADDPALAFDFNGMLDFNGAVPAYDFALDLYRSDLRRLGFNRRDSISTLAGNLEIHGSGLTLDDFNGQARIDRLVYVNHLDTVRTGGIVLSGDNSPQGKLLSLRAPFADADYKGRMSYRAVFGHLKQSLRSYLPSVEGRGTGELPAGHAEGYALLTVDVKQANNVAGIFLPGLRISSGSRLSFLFNPDTEKFSLTATSDFIERGRFFVSELEVNSRSEDDSLAVWVRAEDLFAGGIYMPDFSVVGGARAGRMALTTHFEDRKTGTGALIGIVSHLQTDTLSGTRRMRIRFTPSSITSRGQQWLVSARRIDVEPGRLEVNNFKIFNQEQELRIHGAASSQAGDTLRLRLTDFDLSPLTGLTESRGYRLAGRSNGFAALISGRDGASHFMAGLHFDSLFVNGMPVAPLLFESSWDLAGRRVRFSLTDRSNGTEALHGFYSPADGRCLADAELRNLPLALLNPLLEGVVDGTAGRADARLQVTGKLTNPKLSGTIRIPEIVTTVGYTGVTYRMRDGIMQIRDNRFTVRSANVYDAEGHSALFDMDLDLQRIADLSYDIRVRPSNLLALDLEAGENAFFYGKVYASGAVAVRGNKLGVNLDVTATTDDRSVFFLPLDEKADMSEADFVTFVGPAEVVGTDPGWASRKEMILHRNRRERSSGRSDLNINLALNIRSNTECQIMIDPASNNVIKGRGNGLLNLHMRPRDNEFTMYGDYVIEEGSYKFNFKNIIANKWFVIEPGSSIRWTGQPLDARLDITALYKLKASLAQLPGSEGLKLKRSIPVECYIRLSDRLAQPVITFDVVAPNAEPEVQGLLSSLLNTQESKAMQFFWLLAVNSFYSDMQNGQNRNIGAMGGSVMGFEFLTNQLSNLLSAEDYNIILRYRPGDELNSDEVDFGFSKELIDNRLILEVEGNYDTGNNPTLTNENGKNRNFSGDFAVTYLFDRSGNLRAKGFSRTIDRFDENQGLQESGIGIYYKEDFDTFSDVIDNVRSRFARRRERRRERAAERAARRTEHACEDAGRKVSETADEEVERADKSRILQPDGPSGVKE